MHSRIIAVLMFFLSLAFCAFGQTVTVVGTHDSSGYPRPVSPSNPMPVSMSGSASITTNIEVYKDEAGDTASAELDSSNRVKVNLGSESLGLVSAVQKAGQASDAIAKQKITLVANTDQAITSGLAVAKTRDFITISAMDSEDEFWINYDTAAVINQCQRCYGWVSIPVQGAVEVHVIASEGMDLFIAEGGK